jgi:hypothetical protein
LLFFGFAAVEFFAVPGALVAVGFLTCLFLAGWVFSPVFSLSEASSA